MQGEQDEIAVEESKDIEASAPSGVNEETKEAVVVAESGGDEEEKGENPDPIVEDFIIFGIHLSYRYLRISLVTFQLIILIIGGVYIDWWPSHINIYASDRNNDESLGDTEDENQLLQIWQSVYLAVSLLCTFYGAWKEDRGFLMLSMFLNIGIMSLIPFRSANVEMPFTFFVFLFSVLSVALCFTLSEMIQNRFYLDDEVTALDTKRTMFFFDIPDLNIYHLGVVQVLTSAVMIFMGLLWMLLQEAMITESTQEDLPCGSWPNGNCSGYYGFKAQEFYVGRMTIALCVAGVAGILAGLVKCRILLTLALVLTILPFTAVIENGIYTIGNSEDVRYMCDDPWWSSRLTIYWGVDWDCSSQETYHNTSVAFMIITSSVALFHLWICLRFSEKIQSQDRVLRENNDNIIERLREWLMHKKTSMRLLLALSFFVALGGIIQIAYGADAAHSDQTEENYDSVDVAVLDSPSYIDANFIYGALAILSSCFIVLYYCLQDRTISCLVFCLLVETLAIGIQNLIRRETDLLYGIVEFATNNIDMYPTYINGDARDLLIGSVQVYYIFNILTMLAIFVCLLTSEAMQDESRTERANNSALPMVNIG